ncbi:hypothetical protein NEMIN01_1772 [Nematocida minor]|uniref:uncharacterized protein n=1 Tax=Nematocida minor TaxID=1912983 RepID=UPI002220E1A7|nr:uncharacterized protein NEMIN01_1772 [Nematocida minor]KAI5191988.1 hypothetical protein NEMIN01_1772 [Nematocida minor]
MQKRRYNEEEGTGETASKISNNPEQAYELAIRKSRLLKKEELELITDKVSYGEYFSRYYEVWIKEMVLDGLLDKMWYAERDLWVLQGYPDSFMEFRDFIANKQGSIRQESKNAQALLQTELFDRLKSDATDATPIVIIKNIKETVSIREILSELSAKLEIAEHAVSQSGIADGYKRTLFIRTDMDVSNCKNIVSEVPLLTESIVSVQYLPTASSSRSTAQIGKQFSDKYSMQHTETQCKNILQKMSELLGVPEVYKTVSSLEMRIPKEETADLYMLALRKIFSFCYYCGVKYDNAYEMAFKCGLYHLRSETVLDDSNPETHRKKMEECFETDRVSFLQAIPKEIDIRTFCTEVSDKKEIECKYCNKKFESVEFFQKHLERKKHRSYETSIKLHSDCLQCINSLNYQLVNAVEKRAQKIPLVIYDYMSNNSQIIENEVQYGDLDKKYTILQEGMPIALAEFGQDEL